MEAEPDHESPHEPVEEKPHDEPDLLAPAAHHRLLGVRVAGLRRRARLLGGDGPVDDRLGERLVEERREDGRDQPGQNRGPERASQVHGAQWHGNPAT